MVSRNSLFWPEQAGWSHWGWKPCVQANRRSAHLKVEELQPLHLRHWYHWLCERKATAWHWRCCRFQSAWWWQVNKVKTEFLLLHGTTTEVPKPPPLRLLVGRAAARPATKTNVELKSRAFQRAVCQHCRFVNVFLSADQERRFIGLMPFWTTFRSTWYFPLTHECKTFEKVLKYIIMILGTKCLRWPNEIFSVKVPFQIGMAKMKWNFGHDYQEILGLGGVVFTYLVLQANESN